MFIHILILKDNLPEKCIVQLIIINTFILLMVTYGNTKQMIKNA